MSDQNVSNLEAREKSLARLKEAGLMLDALNMTLDEAIAAFEADIRNSGSNSRRRQEAEKLFANYRKK